jgi:hypothetical protein
MEKLYQNDTKKYSKTGNIFRTPKDMVRHEELDAKRGERQKRWITFYRRNPHRFIEDYFGIHLYPFQVMMIWVLQRSNLAYIVASRAASKTWIIAVWALTLAVLYPGIKIIVCAKTIKQGGLLFEKLQDLQSTHPNVAREIQQIVVNSNDQITYFHCGSTIKVVPSTDSARGNRSNYIIIEESRLVPKEILESVIKPFLEVRTPPYRLKPEYSNDPLLLEEGTISYITSAWYTAEYWYEYVKSCIRRMVEGDETSNFLAFDYLITIYHNIKTEEMIKNEMSDMDAVSVQMEYLNIPSGASGKSYFKPILFNRNVKKAWYPQKEDNYNIKHNPYDIKKVDGEVRLISVDIATRANRANDQTIISNIRMIPLLGRGYNRQLSFMESHKGSNTLIQAKRIKEIFYDFNADYLVLDLQNAGISIFDSLSQVTMSDERGITFPAMTVVGREFDIVDQKLYEELMNRTLGVNAIPIIFPILASQNLNSQIAVAFRSSLQKKLWNFLIADGDAEEFLIKNNKEFTSNPNDSSLFSYFLNPYVQTGLFIGECINLDMSLVNGLIKLAEKPGNYKDRYSSVSYGNWIIHSVFDPELIKENVEENEWDIIRGITMVV